MPLEIRRDDIREIAVDCILNPTDEELSGGGGTDYCIHQAAGPRLRTECDQYSGLKTAEVVVTKAYDMKNCDYILHTVGPIYYKSNASADEDLRRTYENALNKARELGLSSIAMPLVSTGTFGFPKKKALILRLKSSPTSSMIMKWMSICWSMIRKPLRFPRPFIAILMIIFQTMALALMMIILR